MKKFRKTFLIGFSIGTLFFLIGSTFETLSGKPLVFNRDLLLAFGLYQMYAIALTYVNVYFFDYLDTINWKGLSRYRILIGALGGIVLTMITLFILRILQETGIEGKSYTEFIIEESSNGSFYFVSLLITIAITVFFHAFYFYKELQKRKVTEQKIIAGTASAQFDALKNQLDPHFLFNSLNVLTSLIDENPAAAQNFTTSLSKVYRYVLEQKNKELVTVAEELQFARTYVRLLKMRFEDSIVFNIPEEVSNPEAKVVPLSLQLLLENAVKHNVVNSTKPLTISIYEQNNNLVVKNNLQPKETIKKGSGVGLVNIRQRYQLLTDRKVGINNTASHFSVEIPMLTKRISVMRKQENYVQDKRYLRAKEKVNKIKGFYSNLLSYSIVIPILAYINYRTTHFPWVLFPIFGWGLGLLFHGMEAYGYNPFLGKNWEERKLRKFMDEE